MTERGRVTARTRIMLWLLVVMCAVLTGVVLIVRGFLLAEVDHRVDAGLQQEAEEFADFAVAAVDPRTGLALTDPYDVVRSHLRTQYPETHEVHLGVVRRPDRLYGVRQGEPPHDVGRDTALLGRIVDDQATTGQVDTPAGPFRWAKVRALPPPGVPDTTPTWFVTGFFVDGMRAPALATVRVLVVASAVGLLLAAAVAWVVAGEILAPVRAVRQAAAEIGERDLTRRIPVRGRDDIAALAEQFNAMLDRLEEAFATQRRFVDDAGHELRTPITIVRGHLELMGDDPAERAEVVRLCTDELDRMNRIVEELLLLAKAERPDFVRLAPVSLPELTSDIDAKVRALADRRWVLEAMGEGEVWLDEQRVTQAMAQLAQNAVQHTNQGDEIRLGSARVDDRVSFWVTDTGPGVQPDEVDRIFDRFARGSAARGDRGGAGLGLAIVRAIADAHHGRVRVRSTPGEGATFALDLPDRPGGTT
ncbi:Signal transduction histidine kinase [Streptoalloteichus tenebrarius]|uniref:histidine kinase n=1 Tax=Streptoalloteichus tenebrarius (strain ATCC 17920 / DSM 40477 / JCM 4838 / CBS 697.72 / NBRC 16177 / NCIMB 11028 / NRRL B-12390 / A12253. 1 / ISP 5477) TaxID=1933 RepID=A0ABT1HUS2_STRSD|nr:HAMP domain-containing sensor histidine kinase [Streptoalloteichus tenebrarius]MCP2259269.1 Signal transduction histidine kinase [Streptoalloteichus tenebrarius]BFE99028.1 HAMP domain-containing sensor histidine kinase [Streptoalloteichus tenebrarius]